jgi:hypothetical protein
MDGSGLETIGCPGMVRIGLLLALVASVTIGLGGSRATAEEGGVSLWLPGQFGSLAAVPPDPGWSLPVIYYHSSVDAGGGKNFGIRGQIQEVTADYHDGLEDSTRESGHPQSQTFAGFSIQFHRVLPHWLT